MSLSGEKNHERPIERATEIIKGAGIVAVKGLGGFHIACSAFSDGAVSMLRSRENRPFKPFAVMVRDIETARRLSLVDCRAEKLLTSFRAPIVLVPRRNGCAISSLVAIGIRDVGIMLPYTPLHHLFFRSRSCPQALVMTSGAPLYVQWRRLCLSFRLRGWLFNAQ